MQMTPGEEFDGEYVVAIGDSGHELAEDVKFHIRQGFRLWGPPFAYMGVQGNEPGLRKTMLAQALIR